MATDPGDALTTTDKEIWTEFEEVERKLHAFQNTDRITEALRQECYNIVDDFLSRLSGYYESDDTHKVQVTPKRLALVTTRLVGVIQTLVGLNESSFYKHNSFILWKLKVATDNLTVHKIVEEYERIVVGLQKLAFLQVQVCQWAILEDFVDVHNNKPWFADVVPEIRTDVAATVRHIKALQKLVLCLFGQCCQAFYEKHLGCFSKPVCVLYDHAMMVLKRAKDAQFRNHAYELAATECARLKRLCEEGISQSRENDAMSKQFEHLLVIADELNQLAQKKQKIEAIPRTIMNAWTDFRDDCILQLGCSTSPISFVENFRAEQPASKTLGLVPASSASPPPASSASPPPASSASPPQPVVLSDSDMRTATSDAQCAIRVYCTTNQPKEELIEEANAFFSVVLTEPRVPSLTRVACFIKNFVTTITEHVQAFKLVCEKRGTKINILLDESGQDTEVAAQLLTNDTVIVGILNKVKVLEHDVLGKCWRDSFGTFLYNKPWALTATKARDEALREIRCLQDSFVPPTPPLVQEESLSGPIRREKNRRQAARAAIEKLAAGKATFYRH